MTHDTNRDTPIDTHVGTPIDKPIDKHVVSIYTDGACSGNPGVGGWAACLQYLGRRKCISGSVPHTTNNRMEMLAAIKALQALKRRARVSLYSDSRYLQQGITTWMPVWKKKGWKTSAKTKVKNVDMWQQLDRLSQNHDITWHWVKGHADNAHNEHVDMLAKNAITHHKSLSPHKTPP
ncbi:MAG: ribonuclease HI [Alphaproteobacteria bacterium GM7ARS4]|nr:ribonuclease HI [Alphaproteobacteria bacterium GM7ARS4]